MLCKNISGGISMELNFGGWQVTLLCYFGVELLLAAYMHRKPKKGKF
jgi:hypothetical protein